MCVLTMDFYKAQARLKSDHTLPLSPTSVDVDVNGDGDLDCDVDFDVDVDADYERGSVHKGRVPIIKMEI